MESKEQKPLAEAEETAAEEKQGEEIQPFRVSRRDFLIGGGAGVAVGAVIAGSAVSLLQPETPAEVAPSAGEAPAEVAPSAVEVPAEVAEAQPTRFRRIMLNVNGQEHDLVVDVRWTLLETLRNQLGFTGTKRGCDRSECGACTVLLDGKAVNSCTILAARVGGKSILTVEGLSNASNYEQLHPVQRAFYEEGGYMCGFCTAGQMLSTKALLDRNPNPSEEEIRLALSGNLCRCTGYTKIVKSAQTAAKMMG